MTRPVEPEIHERAKWFIQENYCKLILMTDISPIVKVWTIAGRVGLRGFVVRGLDGVPMFIGVDRDAFTVHLPRDSRVRRYTDSEVDAFFTKYYNYVLAYRQNGRPFFGCSLL